jgi:hypothetical protein
MNTSTQQPVTPVPAPQNRKPNDVGGISVEAHIRIFDPKTQQIFVEKRA